MKKFLKALKDFFSDLNEILESFYRVGGDNPFDEKF